MLTHIDHDKQPTMVDITDKQTSLRKAKAESKMFIPKEIIELLSNGEITSAKGPVFQTAIIAGTMAVKNTSSLIPFCHPLPIDGCKIHIQTTGPEELTIQCEVKVFHKTGVEMEALTGATVTALTVYDMCKAMSHDMKILETKLLTKSGGKSKYVHK